MQTSDRTKQINFQISQEQYKFLLRISRQKGLNNLSALIRSALIEYFSLPTDGQNTTEPHNN
jgi:hypothetical protein